MQNYEIISYWQKLWSNIENIICIHYIHFGNLGAPQRQFPKISCVETVSFYVRNCQLL